MKNRSVDFWSFVARRLEHGENVVLLVVAESSGSSPGRQGYKMAVGADGELFGSIGGGVMEVNLVEEARRFLSVPPAIAGGLREQVHRRDVANSSGMICSGKQTVILKLLTSADYQTTERILESLENCRQLSLVITSERFETENHPDLATPRSPILLTQGSMGRNPKSKIQNPKSAGFHYTETLGVTNQLHIIGGGHCALALSELMSKMDFRISLFDDRPELNTIEKNRFADDITIVQSYGEIGRHITDGEKAYVVVMTLGYQTDAEVIRALIGKDFKYFGVLGSSAKMATMLKELAKEGVPRAMLDRIRTPVGLPINSRTPEEIAVSIAAEIISVKNAE